VRDGLNGWERANYSGGIRRSSERREVSMQCEVIIGVRSGLYGKMFLTQRRKVAKPAGLQLRSLRLLCAFASLREKPFRCGWAQPLALIP
jgi:hypothetical protein